MGAKDKERARLVGQIVGRLTRQHSTAMVLFHHAVAERLGLGPTDHKCLDLLRERGPMSGSALAAITGLTSGAITGVVGRLELAGYLRREADPHDGRKQVLIPKMERMHALHDIFAPIHADATKLLEGFDTHQLATIADFLNQTSDLALRHVALLRGQALQPHDVDRDVDHEASRERHQERDRQSRDAQ